MTSILGMPNKDPDEILDYTIDWPEDRIGTDTISASTWIVPVGITQNSASFTDTSTTIWLSGGTEGERYDLVNRITTSGGRTVEQTISLKVMVAPVGLVSLQYTKMALKIEANDWDVLLESVYIPAASRAVINYLKSAADALLDLDSNGNPPAGFAVPEEIQMATIALVGYWFRNPDSDPDKEFEQGYLPRPVTALLYPLRTPAIA